MRYQEHIYFFKSIYQNKNCEAICDQNSLYIEVGKKRQCIITAWNRFYLRPKFAAINKILFSCFAACRPGFYKAFAGNVKCSKCPPHSLTYAEATSVCQCEKGYFRAEKDPPTMACTRKSDQYPCL